MCTVSLVLRARAKGKIVKYLLNRASIDDSLPFLCLALSYSCQGLGIIIIIIIIHGRRSTFTDSNSAIAPAELLTREYSPQCKTALLVGVDEKSLTFSLKKINTFSHYPCLFLCSIRSVITSVAGSAAGVFGLTNFSGFYCYLASLVLTNIAIFVVNVQFQPRRYLLSFNPAKDPLAKGSTGTSTDGSALVAWRYISFLMEGAQEMAFGYVLWWTLWTAIIHGESQCNQCSRLFS